MENDIVVTDKTFIKVLGKNVLKTVAFAAAVTVGVTLATKVMSKSDDNES